MRRSQINPKRTTPRRKGEPATRIKAKRLEDPAHLARVRSLPCLICHAGYSTQTTPTEAHHIRQGVGMGQKASDHETISLCSWHHRTGPNAFHNGPSIFQWLYGTERELLARTLKMLEEVG